MTHRRGLLLIVVSLGLLTLALGPVSAAVLSGGERLAGLAQRSVELLVPRPKGGIPSAIEVGQPRQPANERRGTSRIHPSGTGNNAQRDPSTHPATPPVDQTRPQGEPGQPSRVTVIRPPAYHTYHEEGRKDRGGNREPDHH